MLELYKDLIIDHGNNPRNKYKMLDYTHFSRGYNYLCGDQFDIYLLIKKNVIEKISFFGVGCVISTASSSLMTINLDKKSIDNGSNIFTYFINILRNKEDFNENFFELNLLSNVKKFPNRVKCATLIWHTFNSAIKNNNKDFSF